MKRYVNLSLAGLATAALLALALTACSTTKDSSGTGATGDKNSSQVSGSLTIDGSSTVTPIMTAVAEEFMNENSKADVAVGTSGTGGGFKKFFGEGDELDIAMASRPISEKEIALATEQGVEFIEIPVAMDGLTVVINPKNTFAANLTVAELKAVWEPGSKVTKWSQVRAGFPDQPISLYGPGTDSGTFDYFTLAVNGEEKASRSQYQASEDDNILVQGITGDANALGYFGYAYYIENKDKLTAVGVDNGTGPVLPSEKTILDGTYQPLSRPIFIYVKKSSLEKPVVQAFLQYLLTQSSEIVAETGYVPMSSEVYALSLAHVKEGKTGTRFHGAQVGVSIDTVLKSEAK